MAKQLIETIGQFQDALLKDRATIVTVPGANLAHFDGLIERCYRHYGAVPKDGALLRAIGDVARHRGCPPRLVRRMTLEEFNAALDEVLEPPPPPANSRGVSLQDAAERIRPDDPEGQKQLVRGWQKSRTPKLPAPIGKCPDHSQRNLYEPAAILRFLKQFEGPEADRDFALSAYFRKVSRRPRPTE